MQHQGNPVALRDRNHVLHLVAELLFVQEAAGLLVSVGVGAGAIELLLLNRNLVALPDEGDDGRCALQDEVKNKNIFPAMIYSTP